MKVNELICLLQSMPQEAHVVVTSEGIAKSGDANVFRENAPDPSTALLNGFSASELLREQIDVLVLREDLVAIALVVNSKGDPV